MTLRILAIAVVLLGAVSAEAQVSISGSLSGRVTDPTAAAVAGAAVQVTNTETGQSLSVMTDDRGLFTFPRLSPGTYSLTVEMPGFQRVTRDGIGISVNQAAVADAVLPVGAVTEIVSVEAGAAITQSQTTELSQLVEERRVRELPLNGKDFQKLLALAPGVSPAVVAGNPAINGSRPSNNNFTVDGITFNNEEFTQGLAASGGAAGLDNSSPNLVSTEAIREFRVITSNADATFGRGSGGQVNIVTRQGTNDLRGSVYYFLRNDALDARDFFDTGATKPPFEQNLYGGTVGGRLVPGGSHFFFGSFEGFRQERSTQSSVVVPNAALIGLVPGDLGRFYRAYYIERGVVPATGNPAGIFSPLPASERAAAVAAGFNAALFDGDLSNSETGTTLLSTTSPRNIDQDGFTLRTDHSIGRLNLSARYLFSQPKQTSSAGLPVDVTETTSRVQQGVVQLAYTVSPSQIIEARGGLLRSRLSTGAQGGLDSRLAAAGLSPRTGIQFGAFATALPYIFLAPEIIFDRQTTPQGFLMHTLARGRLTLRSGLDIRRHENTFRFGFLEPPFYALGGYVGFDGLIGAFPGQPQVMSGFASATQFGADDSGLRNKVSLVQEYFTQADVRVAPRITLNLGLRYSYFGVYRETSDRESNLYSVDAGGGVVADASPFEFGRAQNRLLATADDRPLYQPDRNNFQPRLGLAWTVGDAGRTVVRASYGLFHDRIFSGQFDNNTSNPPFATSGAAFAVPVLLGTPLPIIPDTPSIYAIDPAVRNPSTHQFNATIERAIGSHMSATASYVGARARGLLRGLEPNGSGFVPQALRPDPRFVDQRFITNYSSSDYDALQIALRRRMAGGVDVNATYTLGRSQDDTSADTPLSFDRIPSLVNRGASAADGFQGGGALFVERPRGADVADSAFDVRHALTVSHIVDLPFRFSLAGILRFHTGTPVNVTLGRDVNDDGDTSQDRPALLSGSLESLYARDGKNYLVSQDQARRLLGVPADVTDPGAAIPRNALRGPDVLFYDVSLMHRIATGRSTVSLELNVFNLFNRTNFGQPVSDLSSPFFGQVTGTRKGTNPRQIQLGVRLSF